MNIDLEGPAEKLYKKYDKRYKRFTERNEDFNEFRSNLVVALVLALFGLFALVLILAIFTNPINVLIAGLFIMAIALSCIFVCWFIAVPFSIMMYQLQKKFKRGRQRIEISNKSYKKQ